MRGKDKIECVLASIVVLTYCTLVVTGKADLQGFCVLAMYIVKKFFDGVEKQNNGG